MVAIELKAKKNFDQGQMGGFSPSYSQSLPKYTGPSRYEVVAGIADIIQVQSYNYATSSEQPYLNYSLQSNSSHYPIQVGNYTSVVNVISGIPSENLWLSIDPDKKLLTLHDTNSILETFPIDAFFTRIAANLPSPLKASDMTYEIVGKTYDIKLLMNSISVPNPVFKGSADLKRDGYYSGVALIRKK